MMKRIDDFIGRFSPFAILIPYYSILALCCFLFITPVSAETPQAQYVKEWKCPYCYHHWKYGEKCQHKECPSTQW